MIRITFSLPVSKFNNLIVKRVLVRWYLWYFFFFFSCLGVKKSKMIPLNLQVKRWSFLVGPKCHKRGQRGFQLKNRLVCIICCLRNYNFYHWWGLVTSVRYYVLFYNLFLAVHNCFLVKLCIRGKLVYKIFNKIDRCWQLHY